VRRAGAAHEPPGGGVAVRHGLHTVGEALPRDLASRVDVGRRPEDRSRHAVRQVVQEALRRVVVADRQPTAGCLRVRDQVLTPKRVVPVAGREDLAVRALRLVQDVSQWRIGEKAAAAGVGWHARVGDRAGAVEARVGCADHRRQLAFGAVALIVDPTRLPGVGRLGAHTPQAIVGHRRGGVGASGVLLIDEVAEPVVAIAPGPHVRIDGEVLPPALVVADLSDVPHVVSDGRQIAFGIVVVLDDTALGIVHFDDLAEDVLELGATLRFRSRRRVDDHLCRDGLAAVDGGRRPERLAACLVDGPERFLDVVDPVEVLVVGGRDPRRRLARQVRLGDAISSTQLVVLCLRRRQPVEGTRARQDRPAEEVRVGPDGRARLRAGDGGRDLRRRRAGRRLEVVRRRPDLLLGSTPVDLDALPAKLVVFEASVNAVRARLLHDGAVHGIVHRVFGVPLRVRRQHWEASGAVVDARDSRR
jgi:hypothetical protein